MLLLVTLGIFLHFLHYQKSGNLSTLLLAHLILLGHQRHFLLRLPDRSVDHTQFFYYDQTYHWDDIHNDKEEQDYAIFSTSQKNFPTFSEQIPTKCKPIDLLSSWFDKLSVSASDEAKKHPMKTWHNVSKQTTKTTKTSESLILQKRRQANLQKKSTPILRRPTAKNSEGNLFQADATFHYTTFNFENFQHAVLQPLFVSYLYSFVSLTSFIYHSIHVLIQT